MKDIRVKTKGLVIGVSLFHLFTFSPMANAQQRSWTADNGNGTYTNPLFYDEFSDPTSCGWATTTTSLARRCTPCQDW